MTAILARASLLGGIYLRSESRMMHALLQPRYGTTDDLALGRTEPPSPGDDEVLLRVRAASRVIRMPGDDSV
ncbi:MAG: hypothetical protein B7733_05420 [Myxococcales bacterium FL481]|nr:MAG: hypothetical protein B7733_05420 [Myxococcales bacterium FL481]